LVTYINFPDRILWRRRIDGSERLRLTLPPALATMPRWWPDGKRIVYVDTATGKPWKIHLISAEGGNPEPLLNEPENQNDPNWSPDGNSIIFSCFPLFDRVPPEKLGVYMVVPRTQNVSKLPGSDGLWVPRWSSDGSHIAARSADSQSLMLFDFATQTWPELARDVLRLQAARLAARRNRPVVRRPVHGLNVQVKARSCVGSLKSILSTRPYSHHSFHSLLVSPSRSTAHRGAGNAAAMACPKIPHAVRSRERGVIHVCCRDQTSCLPVARSAG
jgi:hypothetical protein